MSELIDRSILNNFAAFLAIFAGLFMFIRAAQVQQYFTEFSEILVASGLILFVLIMLVILFEVLFRPIRAN